MKTDLQMLSTKTGAYEKRLQVWNGAIEAANRHIQIAKAFQEAGVKLIKQIRDGQGNAEDLSKCLASLERGANIEREANRELIDLYNIEPRDK